jgi:hypothetical protein
MLRHHLAFQIRPAIGRDRQLVDANKEEALVGAHHFPVGRLESRGALTHLWAGIVDEQTRFFQKLSTSRILIAFARVQAAARRRPEDLPGEGTGLVLELEEKDAFLLINDQQAG